MNEVINCADMITRVFSNIDVNSLENATKLTSIWKTVVRGIKNTRDEFYGDKIAAHSDVIDLKNGQLLIETDHPGWIQVMQLHQKFIIRGLNMKLPDLKISSLVFRLKGNDAVLFDSYEESLEKSKKRIEEKHSADEKQLDEFYKKNPPKNTEKTEKSLPPEFLAKLASLEQTVLTNSKE